ncbi:tRNA (N(6)-L-threonylcarbamoyladenosine(37)-C(2))-methylthiotransferase MtaB [Saccharicrinis sp. FJH2]|uniref:tRNA (N(6)-L-threonylcarbamoyladenosine(37)-C(2))- methylthiotransferase MtaB n=1 Tax=Saccharicrinis sp. FJH65 TaxID=3344659 RepID=UPI0035F3E0B9
MIDTSVFQKKKVKFHTLGCKLNFSESSAIGTTLKDAGFLNAAKGEPADLVVINTCSVTELADKKCRNAIRSEIRKNPGAYVVVMGCYAQLKPEEIADIEGVDLILGSNEKFRMLDFIDHMEKESRAEVHVSKLKDIEAFYPSYSGSDRTRCFLKIQDGCDYYCSYCTIPFARGRSRSGSVAETIKTAEEAIRDGAREIILTGVNIGDFGKGSEESFYDFLVALDRIDADVRFRIGSVEPNLLTDEIIDLVSGSKHIAPHFHIPLQSGSDEVLKLMRRKYDTTLFKNRVETIKHKLPDAFIGVDVIVGVNGESKQQFEEAYSFISDLDVSQLHVFTYSEREGTQALKIDHRVPAGEKKVRSQRLLMLSDKKTRAFYESQTGKVRPVLFESQNNGGMMFGFTDNYIKVSYAYTPEMINKITHVKLTGMEHQFETMTCKMI